jgi:hypothetical protein
MIELAQNYLKLQLQKVLLLNLPCPARLKASQGAGTLKLFTIVSCSKLACLKISLINLSTVYAHLFDHGLYNKTFYNRKNGLAGWTSFHRGPVM